MKKLYDLCAKTGDYTDREGNIKATWQNVGVVMEGEQGKKFVLLERWFNPAGIANPDNRSNVLLSMFPPKEKPAPSGADQGDDPPPF